MYGAACITPRPPPAGATCQSNCGAWLVGSEDCDGFRAAEDKAVPVIGTLHEGHADSLTPAQLCWALGFEEVHVFDGPWTQYGQTVVGDSCTGLGVIELASDDWTANAYTHELAHIELGCANEAARQHIGWDPDVNNTVRGARL